MSDAQRVGADFEGFFKTMCIRNLVHICVWPRGAEWRGGALRQVPTPCDFVLTMAPNKVVFVDTKHSTDDSNFTKSMITEHQAKQLKLWELDGCVAGYVVYFKKANKIVFFTAGKIWHCFQTGVPCKPYEGLQLGPFENCNPRLIFDKYHATI